MTLKQSIVQWIINHKTAAYSQGLSLYGQLKYKPFLFQDLVRGDIGPNRQILLRELAHALKSGNIPTEDAIVVPVGAAPVESFFIKEEKAAAPIDPHPIDSEDGEDMIPISPSQKLALNTSRLRKERSKLADELKHIPTKEGRADMMSQLKAIQAQIAANTNQMNAIRAGEVFREETPAAPNAKYDIHNIPSDSLERHKCITGAMAIRSKAMKQADNITAEMEKLSQGHPKRHSLKKRISLQTAKWQKMDEYIAACRDYVN